VKLNWKTFRVAVTAAALFAVAGCGGVNGSYNVTPASFFLPGIGQTTPISTNSPNHTVTVAVVE
jgi:hypothetical protein